MKLKRQQMRKIIMIAFVMLLAACSAPKFQRGAFIKSALSGQIGQIILVQCQLWCAYKVRFASLEATVWMQEFELEEAQGKLWLTAR